MISKKFLDLRIADLEAEMLDVVTYINRLRAKEEKEAKATKAKKIKAKKDDSKVSK